jgi:hypothetical protein
MTEAPKHTIWYRKDDGTWQEFTFIGEMTIGRVAECELVIDEEAISSRHATLSARPDGIWLTDLDSESGTSLGGEPVTAQTPTLIEAGQEFIVGGYGFTLVDPEPIEVIPDAVPTVAVEKEPASGGIAMIKEAMEEIGRGKALTAILIGFVVVALIGGGGAWLYFRNNPQQPPDVGTQITPSLEASQPTDAYEGPAKPTVSQSGGDITINAPGLGEVQFSDFNFSTEDIDIVEILNMGFGVDQVFELASEITGQNIAYVYRYSAIEQQNQIITTDMQYITSEDIKEVDGVAYPDWGDDGVIPIEFIWQSGVYQVSDGVNSELALVYPTQFTAAGEQATYAVNGIYTFSDSGETRPAKIQFDASGQMKRIVSSQTTEGGLVNSLWEITPRPGDQFTILLQQFEFTEKEEGEAVITIPEDAEIPEEIADLVEEFNGTRIPIIYGTGHFVETEGGTLTYGDQAFSWSLQEDYPGNYFIGVAAEDLDGNFTIAYAPMLIQDIPLDP